MKCIDRISIDFCGVFHLKYLVINPRVFTTLTERFRASRLHAAVHKYATYLQIYQTARLELISKQICVIEQLRQMPANLGIHVQTERFSHILEKISTQPSYLYASCPIKHIKLLNNTFLRQVA